MISYLTKIFPKPIISRTLLTTTMRCYVHAPAGKRKLDLYQKIREKDMKGIKDNNLSE